LLAAAFLSQAQSKSLLRLLGVPAAVLLAWGLAVFLLSYPNLTLPAVLGVEKVRS
jgi:hypothetical protein